VKDGVVIDSNCCIKAVLEFNNIRDYYKDQIINFIHKSKLNKVIAGYFPVIRDESERNLAKAVSDLFRAVDKARLKLKKLFDEKLLCLPENCTDKELRSAKKFFQRYKKSLRTQRYKNPIPGDNDLRILISTTKQPWIKKGIVSDDSHFTEYQKEIFKEYTIIVLLY
jgi:hypothetical protein